MGHFNKSDLMENNQLINIIWHGWNSCISIYLLWLSLILGWSTLVLFRLWILLLKNQREEGENVACLNYVKWWTNLAVMKWALEHLSWDCMQRIYNNVNCQMTLCAFLFSRILHRMWKIAEQNGWRYICCNF